MNIFFIEDEAILKKLINNLIDDGHKVRHCDNFSDAMYWLDQIAFRQRVDIILLDLTMPATGLPDEYIFEAQKDGLCGWFFYDKVIKEDYPDLLDKIILYTGFGKELVESGYVSQEEYDKLRIVHKLEKESTDNVLAALKSFEEEKYSKK
ncbi:MAG: hypothetical protein FWC41_08725 [Firmicutes bacterium]|nr:hypothetical protein [Bacillota bacterium]